ncbi:hypothetical protein PFISCL1PPCAC_11299, partial [Pristionchus fissidentatus]
QFTFYPEHLGVYTCEFGKVSGRLFIHTITVFDGKCVDTVSATFHKHNHTFLTQSIKVMGSTKRSLYALENRLWLRDTTPDVSIHNKDCVV